MQLPFLKESKIPRINMKPLEEKSYGLNSEEKLEDHCMTELFEACESKNVKAFRAALEAIVMNCFEMEEPNA